MNVHFANVGRLKKSWSEATPLVNENFLFRSIKRNKAILSDDINFALDGTRGKIYVAGRNVGEFTIEDK